MWAAVNYPVSILGDGAILRQLPLRLETAALKGVTKGREELCGNLYSRFKKLRFSWGDARGRPFARADRRVGENPFPNGFMLFARDVFDF